MFYFLFYAALPNAADLASQSHSLHLATKRDMTLVMQEFRDNITKTYNQLKAKHLKERKKLVRLIKQENERPSLSACLEGEDNRVIPTPRARPVYLNKGFVDNLDIDYPDLFAMNELSSAN